MAPIERAVQWWASLQARERRVLGLGGGLTALVLLYLLAFEPAWVGRQRLQAELPTLRAQLAQMESLAAEARQLAGQSGKPVDSPQQLKLSLEQSIKAAGLSSSVTQLTVAGELMDLRFKGVPFAAWLTWLDSALRETRLRVVDMALERDATPGAVTARVTLEPPKRTP